MIHIKIGFKNDEFVGNDYSFIHDIDFRYGNPTVIKIHWHDISIHDDGIFIYGKLKWIR